MCSKFHHGNYLLMCIICRTLAIRTFGLHITKRTPDYLLVSELPDFIEFGSYYKVIINNEIFGSISEDRSLAGTSLINAMHSMVNNNQWTYGILCLGQLQSADGLASVLLVHQNDCYIFDPHSRNANGKPTSHGTSVLLHFQNAEECLYIYITCLFHTL